MSDRLTSSDWGWTSASDDIRAGDPPIVQRSSDLPRNSRVAMSTDTFLARMALERALLALERRTAGRTPTRAERRLEAHYQRQLLDLDNGGIHHV